MKILGWQIARSREAPEKALSPVSGAGRGGWFTVMESYPGAWQQNVEINRDSVMAFHAVYSCMSLIASDVAKLRVKLVQQDETGVWSEVENPAYSPVLRKPNNFQNRIQFWESYILSKLSTGNTYVLKRRDNRGVVTALYVLDPRRVTPLVTDDGDVYYQLAADNLPGIAADLTVPAREIIHDRMNTIYHPLVGTSPIIAAGIAATQGLNIQGNFTRFFGNGARPGGILTAPGNISDETAQRLKNHWETNYSGANAGRIAVLGDGLSYTPMMMSATDAQVIEQLQWSAEVVASTFHVPPYKIGVGGQPNYNNVQNLNLEYYTQCLQILLESAELCLDEGLGLDAYVGNRMGTEFDQDGLLRMDTKTQVDVLASAKDFMTLNERRKRFDLERKPYGDTIYMQMQDHSAEAISARDAALIAGPAEPQPVDPVEPTEAEERAFMAETLLSMRKAMEAA